MEIDIFTPCLENAKTGELVSTSYCIMSKAELRLLKNWQFNWNHSDLRNATVYKLIANDDCLIQGLIAVTDAPGNNAIYINIAESAPHNVGKDKQYYGVGGHLFAIAAKHSVKSGYGGFLFMDAKNIKLVSHYIKAFRAVHIGGVHPYRMIVDEEAANRLLKIYSLEE